MKKLILAALLLVGWSGLAQNRTGGFIRIESTNAETLGGVAAAAYALKSQTQPTNNALTVLAADNGSALTNLNLRAPLLADLYATNNYFVFEGDSIITGTANSNGWSLPDRLAVRSFFTNRGTIYRVGVGGSLVANVAARYAANVYPYRPAGGNKSYLFLAIGVNDVAGGVVTNSATSVAAWYASYSNYIAHAQEDGFTVIPFSVLYFTDATDTVDLDRMQTINRMNALILNSTNVTQKIDSREMLGNPRDPVLFQSDYLHPSNIGQDLWAEYVNGQMLAGLTKRSANGITDNTDHYFRGSNIFSSGMPLVIENISATAGRRMAARFGGGSGTIGQGCGISIVPEKTSVGDYAASNSVGVVLEAIYDGTGSGFFGTRGIVSVNTGVATSSETNVMSFRTDGSATVGGTNSYSVGAKGLAVAGSVFAGGVVYVASGSYPTAALTTNGCAFWPSNGVVYLLTSSGSTAWAATNKLAP